MCHNATIISVHLWYRAVIACFPALPWWFLREGPALPSFFEEQSRWRGHGTAGRGWIESPLAWHPMMVQACLNPGVVRYILRVWRVLLPNRPVKSTGQNWFLPLHSVFWARFWFIVKGCLQVLWFQLSFVSPVREAFHFGYCWREPSRGLQSDLLWGGSQWSGVSCVRDVAGGLQFWDLDSFFLRKLFVKSWQVCRLL